MKFLNKFWLVAVVSVGLFSCKTEPPTPKNVITEGKDSLTEAADPIRALKDYRTAMELDFGDSLVVGTSATSVLSNYSPLGSGRVANDYNLTILDSAGFALLKVIQTVVATPPASGLVTKTHRTIKLNSQIALLSVNTTTKTLSVTDVTSHWLSTSVVPFSNYFDLKYTDFSPYLTPGAAAIVGAEDPRDGVYKPGNPDPYEKGYHYIYRIGGFIGVRISQPVVGGELKFSHLGTSQFRPSSGARVSFCGSGVPLWDKDFSKVCP